MFPVGDFIAQVSKWTGRPLGEFLALVRGMAPESAGSFPELTRLVAVLRANAGARALLGSDADAGEIIGRLKAEPGDVGAAARGYLDIVGYRLLDSLDTGDPYALEVPGVLVQAIRRAVDEGAPVSSVASKEEVVKVRDQVPADNRDAFDALLAEARFTSKLRDERGLYSEVWAGGITRRAILAGGARLVKEGRLQEPAHLVEAGYDEIKSILRGDGGPSGEELAARAGFRASHWVSEAPSFLGSPPQPPPPLDGLPPGVARMMGAIGSAIHALFGQSEAVSEAAIVRGIGASPGVYTGTARLIESPAEFDRLQRGDVLVTASTTVTDSGGLLSHAAIVSREYGIPGVVGCHDATSRITDGMRVRVDGLTGEVSLNVP
jgi:phosphohistidine swiveling domain-containing protein